jgi:CRISPR/Cas system CSM-associated protein Csm3 (group 7 of RAMP superfamily)
MSHQTTVKIELTISLQSPLSVGAAGSRGGLADKSIMRDGWNRPLIPGSQIKGRIRHACERIAHALGCPICRAPVAETMCPDSPPDIQIERQATEKKHRQRAKERDKKTQQCVVCAIFGSPLYPSRLIFQNAVQVLEEAPKEPLPLNDPLRTGVGLDRRRRGTSLRLAYKVTRSC